MSEVETISCSTGNIVASYGSLNAPGFGKKNASEGLNAPYDAKRIGDYTGLTPPFDDEYED